MGAIEGVRELGGYNRTDRRECMFLLASRNGRPMTVHTPHASSGMDVATNGVGSMTRMHVAFECTQELVAYLPQLLQDIGCHVTISQRQRVPRDHVSWTVLLCKRYGAVAIVAVGDRLESSQCVVNVSSSLEPTDKTGVGVFCLLGQDDVFLG